MKAFLDGRYVSASECVHRLLEFPIQQQTPNVVRLHVHLPHQQTVVLPEQQGNPEDARIAAAAALRNSRTTLTEWFAFNRAAPADYPCRSMLYHDFPSRFWWDAGKRSWVERQRASRAVGRMYFVQPTAGERYYLRLLLCHVAGATSFADLRTVGGVMHETFKAACEARGLLAIASCLPACWLSMM
jgi:hypothetical protein